MKTLQYLRQQPETNDPSDVWMPSLAANVSKDDVHNHDGVNSKKLTSVLSNTITTQSILAAAWVLVSGGRYRQVITLPVVGTTQINYDDVSMQFRLSTGEIVNPTIEKISATTYYVYTVDNSQALTVLYSV